MTNTPVTTTAKTDSPSIHCVICGYLLRGLDATGRCPECGTAIQRSMRGDALADANPRWLWWIRLGVAGMELVNALNFTYGLLDLCKPELLYGPVARPVAVGVFMCQLVLLTFCSFAISAREPGRLHSPRRPIALMLRIGAVSILLADISLWSIPHMARPTRAVVVSYYALALGVDLIGMILTVASALLFISWMKRDDAQALKRWMIALLILGPVGDICGPVAMRTTQLAALFGWIRPSIWPRYDNWTGLWITLAVALLPILIDLWVLRRLHRAYRAAKTASHG